MPAWQELLVQNIPGYQTDLAKGLVGCEGSSPSLSIHGGLMRDRGLKGGFVPLTRLRGLLYAVWQTPICLEEGAL